MKLFAIKDPSGKLVAHLHFSNKEQAKKARDELNKATPGHVVTPGPDHHRFKTAY